MTSLAPGGLVPLAQDIWIAEGPVIRFWGIPFPTRMVVVRLADGGLWLHSPVEAAPALVQAVTALGEVRHLVAPNWVHYAFLPGWQALFSKAVTWAAPGVRERSASRGVAIRFDADLGPEAPPDWAGQIDQLLVTGHPRHREVVFHHRASGSLILTDLLQALQPETMTRADAIRARLLAGTSPGGQMPPLMRLGFTLGRKSLAEAVARMQAWAPARLIYAHGPLPEAPGPQALAKALGWALPRA